MRSLFGSVFVSGSREILNWNLGGEEVKGGLGFISDRYYVSYS